MAPLLHGCYQGDSPLWDSTGRHKEASSRTVAGGGKLSNDTVEVRPERERERDSNPFSILHDVV